MHLRLQQARALTRRTFFSQAGLGLGAIALSTLLEQEGHTQRSPRTPDAPRTRSRARAVIYIHLSGAPPSLDMFDYKPRLNQLNGQPCPQSLLQGERFAFIKGVPKMLGSPYRFARYGQSGAWVCELLPHTASIVDDIAIIHSVHTDQFNHAPAELFLYTGAPHPGSASLGSWITYGLGSANKDLPGFVVLLSGGTDPTGGKSLWSSGFLPSIYQGVQCRSEGEPVLYLNNPPGMDRATRRRSLDALARLNQMEARQFGDPETLTRIAQYEMAFRMQITVPDVMSIAREPQYILDMYGARPGHASFANNCLLARRLVEKGVRYVQLYDWGWDIHGTGAGDDLIHAFPNKCRDMDRPAAALIKDLKQRGLLDQTLVILGGEFGRTPMNEERNGSKYLGRDHHPHCFTLWMAGGGIKPGLIYGETDELGYRIARNPVSIRDLQATILHLMGLDPYRLAYKYQGLDQRLIGPTNEAKVVQALFT
ncbi:MAG: DUF1501 domain-containing protein [Chloroherpetonaceae bacterium]|nr:DUF1501 domain-containing protein [Chthonomonadaceae bacterium]MDW8208542.1 DUF1501 domain-containing protein [Chloroherpetonaceae bacterium]